MKSTNLIALVVLSALVALVAGCGGGSSTSTSTSTSTLSVAQSTSTPTESTSTSTSTDSSSADSSAVDAYGKAVSDEFASFNTDFTTLGQKAASPASKQDYLNTVSQLQARVGQTVDKLKGLDVPSEAQQFNDDAISALEDLQTSFDPIKQAVESNDKAAVQKAATGLQAAAQKFEQEFTTLDSEAKAAGIPVENLAAPSGG